MLAVTIPHMYMAIHTSQEAHIASRGSRNFFNLHEKLEPEWIPREQNELTDYLSRLVEYDDWMLNPGVFNILEAKWGPHTVDRFANLLNRQVPRFNSWFWEPGTEAVDAFTCSWADDNNWLCPPVYLIPRVLRHAQNMTFVS